MIKKCSVEGCNNHIMCKDVCAKHYYKLRKYGDPLKGGVYAPKGTGTVSNGYLVMNGEAVHISVAEKALGKKLPLGVEIHHVDYNRLNNVGSNLVICPNRSYHKLLHVRTEALEACGNADYRKCRFCKQYDDPTKMSRNNAHYHHKQCKALYERVRYQEIKLNGYKKV